MITKKRMSEMYELNRTLATSIMFGVNDLEDYLEKTELSLEAQLSIVTFELQYVTNLKNVHEDVLRYVNYAFQRMCKDDVKAGNIKNIWDCACSMFCYTGNFMEVLYPDTQKILRDHLMNNIEHFKEEEKAYTNSFGTVGLDPSRKSVIQKIANNIFDNDEDRVKFVLLVSS
jgi:hypothetical protein